MIDEAKQKRMANKVQYQQTKVAWVQRQFPDSTLAFKAGALAYESLRLFWYAITQDDDGGHIAEVEQALDWVRESLT